MYLKKLSILNFKSYLEANLQFNDGANFFTGNNGEGKTNLLDAIHYLSLCKSYFNPIDNQNVLRGQEFMMIQGEFDKNEVKDIVHCAIKKGQKKQFKRNKKEYSRLADHVGLFPLVMISPSDINLIIDGSEIRRKLIDSIISQYSKSYLDDLIGYNRIMAQRNSLLKYFAKERKFDATSLEVWNGQLMEFGNRIFDKRKEFLIEFVPAFQKYYNFISGDEENVELHYESQLNDSRFEDLLKSNLEKDRAMQYTTTGIHKDDLIFKLNDFPVKKFGSQGQQKSYLIALKLAHFEFIKGVKNITPLLLLDDIFDKLDNSRVQKMMELISQSHFGQIFITDTSKDRVAKIFEDIEIGQKYFEIHKGAVVNEENK